MNHKQKLGYMALGAGILALGIAIGQFITPSIEAQSNGVFDAIVCRSLEVVDEKGNKAIVLGVTNDNERIMGILNEAGESAITIAADEKGSGITLNDNTGQPAIALFAVKLFNTVEIRDKRGGNGIRLHASNGLGNRAQVYDRGGNVRWEAP